MEEYYSIILNTELVEGYTAQLPISVDFNNLDIAKLSLKSIKTKYKDAKIIKCSSTDSSLELIQGKLCLIEPISIKTAISV